MTERLIPIKGTPPSLINLPSGCAFHPRCRYAGPHERRRAYTVVPELVRAGGAHPVRCHLTAQQRRRRSSQTEIKPNLEGIA